MPLLRDAKREVQLIVDSHRSYWADIGCTIMGDGWIDTRHRTLINFLVYCPKGIILNILLMLLNWLRMLLI